MSPKTATPDDGDARSGYRLELWRSIFDEDAGFIEEWITRTGLRCAQQDTSLLPRLVTPLLTLIRADGADGGARDAYGKLKPLALLERLLLAVRPASSSAGTSSSSSSHHYYHKSEAQIKKEEGEAIFQVIIQLLSTPSTGVAAALARFCEALATNATEGLLQTLIASLQTHSTNAVADAERCAKLELSLTRGLIALGEKRIGPKPAKSVIPAEIIAAQASLQNGAWGFSCCNECKAAGQFLVSTAPVPSNRTTFKWYAAKRRHVLAKIAALGSVVAPIATAVEGKQMAFIMQRTPKFAQAMEARDRLVAWEKEASALEALRRRVGGGGGGGGGVSTRDKKKKEEEVIELLD